MRITYHAKPHEGKSTEHCVRLLLPVGVMSESSSDVLQLHYIITVSDAIPARCRVSSDGNIELTVMTVSDVEAHVDH